MPDKQPQWTPDEPFWDQAWKDMDRRLSEARPSAGPSVVRLAGVAAGVAVLVGLILWGGVGESRVGESRVGESRVEELRVEESRVEELRVVELRVEEVRVEELRVEELRVEELRVEELRVGESGVEGLRVGELRVGESRVGGLGVEGGRVKSRELGVGGRRGVAALLAAPRLPQLTVTSDLVGAVSPPNPPPPARTDALLRYAEGEYLSELNSKGYALRFGIERPLGRRGAGYVEFGGRRELAVLSTPVGEVLTADRETATVSEVIDLQRICRSFSKTAQPSQARMEWLTLGAGLRLGLGRRAALRVGGSLDYLVGGRFPLALTVVPERVGPLDVIIPGRFAGPSGRLAEEEEVGLSAADFSPDPLPLGSVELNRLGFSASSGVSYRLFAGFRLTAAYHYRASNVYANDRFRLPRHRLGVGLRYGW